MDKQYLSLRKIQLIENDILIRVVDCLTQYNINYILCGGTMLGAVRHKGFIPWDDDIDLLVPREDYDRLIELIKNRVIVIEDITLRIPGDKGYPTPYIKAVDLNYKVIEDARDEKFQGYIWIDIFPLDHFPDNKMEHKRYLRKNRILRDILVSGTTTMKYMKQKWEKSRLLLYFGFFGARILYGIMGGYKRITLRIDDLARDMNRKNIDSNHVGDGTLPNGEKDYFSVNDTTPVILAEFEGEKYNIPQNYDSYLRKFYGDYMQLPPIEQRGGHHIKVEVVKQL